jgi:hypothetical protein
MLGKDAFCPRRPLITPFGKPESSQQASLVSRIKIHQGEGHIHLSCLFSSPLVAGFTILKQTFDYSENMLDLCPKR